MHTNETPLLLLLGVRHCNCLRIYVCPPNYLKGNSSDLLECITQYMARLSSKLIRIGTKIPVWKFSPLAFLDFFITILK